MLIQLEGEGSPGHALLLAVRLIQNRLQQGRMRTEALVTLGAFGWGVLYHQETVLETAATYMQKMRENA